MAQSRSTSHKWSIVASDKFVRATRDSGYRSTASAISELVDNAIQAGATRIYVDIRSSDELTGIEVSVQDMVDAAQPWRITDQYRIRPSAFYVGPARALIARFAPPQQTHGFLKPSLGPKHQDFGVDPTSQGMRYNRWRASARLLRSTGELHRKRGSSRDSAHDERLDLGAGIPEK